MAASTLIKPEELFAQQNAITNWAGNLTYSTTKIALPRTTSEVQELVKKFDRLKVLGTKHCFNTIADSNHQLISLQQMNKVVTLDESAKTVTIEGGMSYGQLCPFLQSSGYALQNLASLPHISVAGACTTATHGSGVNNGNLSTAVSGLEIVLASGDIINLSRKKDGEKFNGAVVGLGSLGVITKVTLDLVPAFLVRQDVFEHLPLEQLKKHFDEIVSGGYSVSLFTDWQRDTINEVWVKSRIDNDKKFQPSSLYFGAVAAKQNLHPIAEVSPENCTEQMGVPGPWFDRLPHFKMGFTPSSGKELQSEYFIHRKNAVDAILAVSRLRKEIAPHLLTTEIRTIAPDKLWLSPCYEQPSVAIHFTWKQNIPEVNQLLIRIENVLELYQAKPHWGKLFNMAPPKLRALYPKMDDFIELTKTLDPAGKFRNEFLNKNIFA